MSTPRLGKSPAKSPPSGIYLGPFELEAPIGFGGMGTVWRGRHRGQQLPVAVKVITAVQAREPDYLAAFANEIQAVAGLDHPNIVMVFDHGEVTLEAEEAARGELTAGSPYLVMELLTGGSLSELPGPRGWLELRRLLLDLLSALAHAHARGVIHRDLKLGNVLLGGDTDVRPGSKIIDFGLASHGLREGGLPQELSAGTPAFEAPEQILGRWRDQGPWTDLYALGCMAYALSSGRPPFDAPDVDQILRCHLMVPVPPLKNRVPVPDGFEGWLRRLMAKHPADRFQCAADAAFALRCLPEQVRPYLDRILDRQRESRVTQEAQVGRPSFPAEADTQPNRPPQIDPDTTQVLRRLDVGSLSEEPMPVLLPPVPRDWSPAGEGADGQDDPPVRLMDAGLGLYGLRALRLVGRTAERDLLWSKLRAVHRDGRTHLVLLRGPAGTGKSRLAEWLSELAQEQAGVKTLQAIHNRIAGPADGIERMVARLYGCIGLGREEIEARLERQLSDEGVTDETEWRRLTELIAPARRSSASQRPWFRTPEARYALIRRLLDRHSQERPIIVRLEDVQWGEDSLRFSRALMHTATAPPLPVMLVLTARDEDLADASGAARLLGELLEEPHAKTVQVAALDSSDRQALVHGSLGLEPVLSERVAEHTAGNPLFAVQLVGDWVQRGVVEVGEHGFAVHESEVAELPESLGGVWDRRVQRLLGHHHPESGRALELAAALGRDVDRVEWQAACDEAGVTAEPALLDHMVEGRLARLAEGGWRFVHHTLRDTFEHRARREGRWLEVTRFCAQALEKLYSDNPPYTAERMGRAWLAADLHDRAIPLLLGAAREYRDANELDRALALLTLHEQALAAVDAPPEDVRHGQGWLVRAQVYGLRADFAAAEHWADQTLRAAQATETWGTLRPEALQALADAALRVGRLDRAETAYRQAHELYEKSRTQRGLAACLLGLGRVACSHHQLERAIEASQRALDLFEATDDRAGVADSLHTLGVARRYLGQLGEAMALLRRALDTYREVEAPHETAAVLADMAGLARATQQLDDAEEAYRVALEEYEMIGSHRAIRVWHDLGLLLLARRRFREARRVLERAVMAHDQTGRLDRLGGIHVALMACAAGDRRWSDFDHHYRLASSLLIDHPVVRQEIGWAARSAGQEAAQASQPERARRALLLAQDQYQKLDDQAARAAVAEQLRKLEP